MPILGAVAKIIKNDCPLLLPPLYPLLAMSCTQRGRWGGKMTPFIDILSNNVDNLILFLSFFIIKNKENIAPSPLSYSTLYPIRPVMGAVKQGDREAINIYRPSACFCQFTQCIQLVLIFFCHSGCSLSKFISEFVWL